MKAACWVLRMAPSLVLMMVAYLVMMKGACLVPIIAPYLVLMVVACLVLIMTACSVQRMDASYT